MTPITHRFLFTLIAGIASIGCGALNPPTWQVAGTGSCTGADMLVRQGATCTAPDPAARPAGVACRSASECQSVCCGTSQAQVCLNGVCQGASTACSCASASVGQQPYPTPYPPAPGYAMTCYGDPATTVRAARVGLPAGQRCTDASQCGETMCGCGNGASYYASACNNGVCDTVSACACAAQKPVAATGLPLCSATTPASSCSGSSNSHQTSARLGAPIGAACQVSAQCGEVICDCSNGNYFYAAQCANGTCQGASACACVANDFSATFGADICW